MTEARPALRRQLGLLDAIGIGFGAIVITILSSAAPYIAVAITAIGAVGAPRLAGNPAPLAVVASAAGGRWLTLTIALGAVTAMLGVILSQILGMSRMAFAMSRRADLPRMLSTVHPRYGVPHRAMLAIGAGAAIIAATGTLSAVAAAASFAILVYYAIANWAALRLPASERLYPPIVPMCGLIACILLAVSLSARVIAIGIAVLLVGLAARVLLRSASS